MESTRPKFWDEWEADAWRPPPEETIDEWAERTLRLPRGVSALPGPLSLEMTPYLREVLRAVTDPETEEVVFCTSSQVGKTTALIVIALYYLRVDPWNMFFIMPSDEQAAELNRERFQPTIKESPDLAKLYTGAQGEFKQGTIRLNGCTITFRGAHSPAGLASKPAKIALADEIDKWPLWSGREANPVDLLGERLKTFGDAKFVKCSTPTTKYGYIWGELQQSSNERYHVPCPHCGHAQVLVFGNGSDGTPGIKWPRDASPAEIEAGDLAWYECSGCHEVIHERHKAGMVKSGVWRPIERHTPLGSQRKKRGFHLWAGYSLWPRAGWSKIAARFLRSKKAAGSLMNFTNSWLGELWQVVVSELTAAHVRDRVVEGVHLGHVPEDTVAVTIGADVQAVGELTYQYYVARAWRPNGRSQLVGYGLTRGWEGLYSVAHETSYATPEGREVPVIRPLVDSGFRAREVYDVCRTNGWIPTKGDVRSVRHLHLSEIPIAPESDEVIEFVRFNPDFYKTAIHRLVRQPDSWVLPQGMDEEYFAHMVAEQQMTEVDKTTGKQRVRWKLKSDGLPNHYFDAEILCLVAADLAEISNRREVERAEDAPRPSAPSPAPRPVPAPTPSARRSGVTQISTSVFSDG